MKQLAALALCSVGLLIGCQPSEEEMAKGVVARTKPAGVRVINLTDSTLGVRIGNLTRYELEQGGITPAILVPANKPAQVELGPESQVKTEVVQVEQSKFTTLVVRSGGKMSSFISGSPLSIPGKAVLEFVNPTDESIEFSLSGGDSVKVGPKDSVAREYDPGSSTIKFSGDTLELKYGSTEIVAIYPSKDNGRVKLKQRSLKGTGAPIATGGPSAN